MSRPLVRQSPVNRVITAGHRRRQRRHRLGRNRRQRAPGEFRSEQVRGAERPTATGQHCAAGWTLRPVPGPTFKNSDVRADWFYYNWVDLHDTSGLGPNTPFINATDSDALIAFKRDTQEFITLRCRIPSASTPAAWMAHR